MSTISDDLLKREGRDSKVRATAAPEPIFSRINWAAVGNFARRPSELDRCDSQRRYPVRGLSTRID